MIEDRELLERALHQFPPESGVVERVMRRRDRKRRNQRIGSAVLALIIAVVAIGGLFAAFRRGVHEAPASPTITPSNVSNLKLAWSADLDTAPSAVTFRSLKVTKPFPPTVADGVVYVETDSQLYAFDASCGKGGATCTPEWVADTGTGVSTPATVYSGVVYVTRVGTLYAFAIDCGSGGATCTPLWTADVRRAYHSPVVVDGIVYVNDAVNGTVYAFRAGCGAGGATCKPLWTATTVPTKRQPPLVVALVDFRPTVTGGIVYVSAKPVEKKDLLFALDATTGKQLWFAETPYFGASTDFDNSPTVASGFVFANFGKTLYTFPASCRTDGGRCAAAWTWTYTGQGFGPGAPVVVGGVVYTNSWVSEAAGSTYAFAVDCGSGGVTCEPMWTGSDQGWGEVAVGGGLVLSTTNGSQRLDAYPTSCRLGGSTCTPIWRTPFLTGAPTVVESNDIVYVGTDGGVNRVGALLYAFPASCATEGAECTPAWTWQGSGGWISPPAVEGSMIFAASATDSIFSTPAPRGKLLAFAVETSRKGLSPTQKHNTAIFYVVVAVLGGALLLMRTRRRRLA